MSLSLQTFSWRKYHHLIANVTPAGSRKANINFYHIFGWTDRNVTTELHLTQIKWTLLGCSRNAPPVLCILQLQPWRVSLSPTLTLRYEGREHVDNIERVVFSHPLDPQRPQPQIHDSSLYRIRAGFKPVPSFSPPVHVSTLDFQSMQCKAHSVLWQSSLPSLKPWVSPKWWFYLKLLLRNPAQTHSMVCIYTGLQGAMDTDSPCHKLKGLN